MSRAVAVDLFVEDRGHEEFLRPLIERVAREEDLAAEIRVRSARGGHGRAIGEFKLYQALRERGALPGAPPELLLVAIDANCAAFVSKVQEVRSATLPPLQDQLVAACPDPHVERWYLADPESFSRVVGYQPAVPPRKCERGYYKRILAEAVRRGGHPPTLGGIEFARELVAAMDLYRAGRVDRSLKACVDDLRGRLRRLAARGGVGGESL